MGSLGIVFNEHRARKVLGTLNKLWQGNEGIFKDIVLPQDRWKLPEGPVEQARYLFFSALFMRGGIISEDPFRYLRALYLSEPAFFDPDYVNRNLLPVMIEKKFKSLTPGIVMGNVNGKHRGQGSIALKINEHCESWCHNAKSLIERWQGNPLRIYEGVKNFEDAFARIDYRRNHSGSITGMRRKIFALLTIWLQEKELIHRFPCPIPVDFHALRVLLATEIITLPARLYFFLPGKHPVQLKDWEPVRVKERLINEITFWSESFIAAHKFDHLSINPALWVLSRDLCANHYQNTSLSGGTAYVDSEWIKLDAGFWPRLYRDPCQFCPIEKFCSFAVPAAPYYRWGLLTKMERVAYERIEPLLPGVNWTDFAKLPKRVKSNKR